LAAAALGLFASGLPWLSSVTAQGLFYVIAGVTVVSAAAAVSCRNPMYCAIWFALTLLGTAGLFLLHGAQFLAVATVVVYAGAILVTFLFVLMLAEPSGRAPYDRLSWEGLLSAVGGVVLIGILTTAIGSILADETVSLFSVAPAEADLAAGVLNDDHVLALGREMFGPHLIAVQVGGVLLLAALIGAAAIVAGGKRLEPYSPAPLEEPDVTPCSLDEKT
jgi:NADH-quinone oxidoreductase subunit J